MNRIIKLLFSIFKKVQTTQIYNMYTERHYTGKIIGYRDSYYWEYDRDYKIKTSSGKEVDLNEHWLEPCNIIGRLLFRVFDRSQDIFLERWYEFKIRKNERD
jgi:hypothetical protein